jgi:hypothetical protein
MQGIFTVHGGAHDESTVAELQREYVPDMGLVVHNQNAS